MVISKSKVIPIQHQTLTIIFIKNFKRKKFHNFLVILQYLVRQIPIAKQKNLLYIKLKILNYKIILVKIAENCQKYDKFF